MQTLSITQPTYYRRFHCTGSACGSNCCRDWLIGIDKKTYLRYTQNKDPAFARALSQNVRRIRGEGACNSHYAYIVFDEEGQCSFLTGDGLCGLQLAYGEDYLSKTCATYPRRLVQVDGELERSLCLSCCEAARLALTPEPAMTFERVTDHFAGHEPLLGANMDAIQTDPGRAYITCKASIREACINVLQDRTLRLDTRIFVMGLLLREISGMGGAAQAKDIPETLRRYARLRANGAFADVWARFAPWEGGRAAMHAVVIRLIAAEAFDGKGNAFYQRFFADFQRDAAAPAVAVEKIGALTAKAIERWFAPFHEEYAHMLEHYFVNFVFARAFPFAFYEKGVSPYGHFVGLAEHYARMRMMLSVWAQQEGALTPALALRVISQTTRLYEHSDTMCKTVRAFADRNADSLAHMALLIRDS